VFDLPLEMAHHRLQSQDNMMILIAEKCEGMKGATLEKLKAKRAEDLAKRRAEEARECADVLRQIWQAGVEGKL